jgi:hypothetical protein
MANLRITNVLVVDSTTITASFTENVSPEIGAGNIVFVSQTEGAPSPAVLSVSASTNTLTITTQPLTAQAAYIITFQSTPEVKFTSLNGDSTLFQDGITNTQLIIGPLEPDNPVQQFLLNYLQNNIYDVRNTTTLVNSILQGYSTIMSKALYDIRQTKNENYISFTVTDEQKLRGPGPFDRLLEESAYEVVRVGLNPTGTNATMNVSNTDFQYFPISLLANPYSEMLTASTSDTIGTFNTNDFIITVSNQNVSILTSVIFTYSSALGNYSYNIQEYGYQILNSEYDQDYAFSYVQLNNNQFKLSQSILSDPLFSLQNISGIQVQYQFRNLGRIVDPTSVSITTVLQSIRETIPPIINVFNLAHAPITDQYGNSITSSGVQFTDPNAVSPGVPHPAFIIELPYSLSALPYAIGQYSIDYPTGTVYVYGQDATNSGTGPEPPLATYYYEYTYIANVDYTYDPDTNDIAALSNGSLIGNAGTINFNYEQVLIPGVDYNAEVHEESLTEYVDNRLLALNIVQSLNAPITNVFRIYNETSGEIYNIVRWSNNKIYFTYVNPPNVEQQLGERAKFNLVVNETLFVNSKSTNSNNLQIYTCFLSNNNIIAATEDCIGSSINTSVIFSDTAIFISELWFDSSGLDTQNTNINRLTSIGQYEIDYTNGVVYVAVSNSQSINLGTISYKSDSIVPQYPHVISVDDIYYRINLMNPPNKQFQYLNFADGEITPSTFDNSDEAFLNDVLDAPYEVFNNQIGAFVSDTFYPGVSNSIKFIRGIYEYTDLQNNTSPINFAPTATFNGNVITLTPLEGQEYAKVMHNNTDGYYVNLDFTIFYPSDQYINFDITVIRMIDSAELFAGDGYITPAVLFDGYIIPNKLLLTLNNPNKFDNVVITYNISINDYSRVIVDYNKGDYYIDYSYLADEIIISYEYGDNVLDFRQSMTVPVNTQYYCTYKVGALRDALLQNFGTLINIPELATLDVNLERERYRDAINGAMSSLIVGPTIAAMKNLVQSITHIEPGIIESIFQVWALGSSFLYPNGFNSTGTFALPPGKYGNGVAINTPGQTITLPVSSNLRLEKGSFESWINPTWNGIDNDAPLTFNIVRDGYNISPAYVFIGAAEYHPTYDINNCFTIDKNANAIGCPNKNKDGVFIYYAPDESKLFYRWYCDVIDGYNDGYMAITPVSYTIQVKTPGLFYDVKSISYPQNKAMSITSGNNAITIKINSSYSIWTGIKFIADTEHYILDFGKKANQERVSIYKDPSGYVSLRVFDKYNKSYNISANVSNWQANQWHQVAASWTIDSKLGMDELHLFIDGMEVPNIISYGSRVGPYLHEKFRTIDPEEIVGAVPYDIVQGIDLATSIGSNIVSSSINFTAYNLALGNIITINEPGFNPSGYSISQINGQSLTLNLPMPATLTNGQFVINQTALIVKTEINLYPNIAVSTLSPLDNGEQMFVNDLIVVQGSNTVQSISNDFANFNPPILPGYLIVIDGYTQFAQNYVILNVDGYSLTLNDKMPVDGYGLTYLIYPNTPVEIPGVNALRPSYTITQDGYYNNVLTLINNVYANDLVLINTLGLNHRRIRQSFFQWSNTSNVIQTRMPAPINLDTVDIYHVLLQNTLLYPPNLVNPNNPQQNAYADGYCMLDGYLSNYGYQFSNANNISQSSTFYQPSITAISPMRGPGRTISAKLSTSNINFNTTDGYGFTITIDGYNNIGNIIETLSFSCPGIQHTINQFDEITNITFDGYAISQTQSFGTLQIQERYPITYPENNTTIYPIINYSYPTRSGTNLYGTGTNVITDAYGFFSAIDVGNYILIQSPVNATGTYQILGISADHFSATISSTLTPFTNGAYQVLRATTYRSGLQNGLFTLEYSPNAGVLYALQPYPLQSGPYEFDFYTYLAIKFSPVSGNMFLGTNMYGKGLLNGILDEVNITSTMLTDTRVGEVVAGNTTTITKDFNSLVELQPNANTLTLAHFDAFPFVNDASYYITASKHFIQASEAVNDNFSQSLYIVDNPIIIENNGILNSKGQGTIEFWVNPLFDTGNDPNYRFYFDAAGIEIEKAISINDVSVQIPQNIGQVISVKTQFGNQRIDYFAGGKVLPLTATTQTILLNRPLPNQNTPVIVTYVPSGLQGDRISIYKDPTGYINFDVHASGIDYVVRSPIIWPKGTWHRVKASFVVNSTLSVNNSVRLLVDGYEQGNVLFGEGLLFGEPLIFGSTFSGVGSNIQAAIAFKDYLGELYIGSDYTKEYGAAALISNFRISNIARPVFAPFGDSIDVNYNSNTSMAFPVTKDLYTTLLLNFDTMVVENTDFITLINKYSGLYDFTINVFDNFEYVSSSPIVKNILETLINVLKPGVSRVYINYID